VRTLLVIPCVLASACLAPLPLGAPCELGDACADDLVCTPLEDRAVCAPVRGDAPPPDAPCVERSEPLIDFGGRLATSASTVDPGRSRFAALWSSSANVNNDGDAFFSLIEARSDAATTTVTLAHSDFERIFALAVAYSPVSDRYAAVWSQDGEVVVRMVDPDGAPLGPARPTGFEPQSIDNLNMIVVNGGFELFISIREQDPPGEGGFGAAGLFRMRIADDGSASNEEILDAAIYDGRTLIDTAGDIWFTFSEGQFVENHVSVGRITADGTVELRFQEVATSSGVIGSQVLPFESGPMVMWREQGINVDQICLLSDCANTQTAAPFEPRFYDDGNLEVVITDDDRAQFGFVDSSASEPTLLRFDPADGSTSGFLSLGDGDGFPDISLAVERDATLAVYSGQFQAGSNADQLDLRVICEETGQ
jgi:hypothetical protein